MQKLLDDLSEDYEIKMGYIMERAYKRGFKDAVSLFIDCLRK